MASSPSESQECVREFVVSSWGTSEFALFKLAEYRLELPTCVGVKLHCPHIYGCSSNGVTLVPVVVSLKESSHCGTHDGCSVVGRSMATNRTSR